VNLRIIINSFEFPYLCAIVKNLEIGKICRVKFWAELMHNSRLIEIFKIYYAESKTLSEIFKLCGIREINF